MTTIKELGNEQATLTNKVLSTDGMEATILKAIQSIKGVTTVEQLGWEASDILSPESITVVAWFKSDTEIDEIGISELNMFATFIKEGGADSYEAYNIPEYIYMYERILAAIQG